MTLGKVNYRALTGKEIKQIIINEISNSIINNQQLKAGLCYHKVTIEWGYRLIPITSDIPTPKAVEDIFNVISPDLELEKLQVFENEHEVLREKINEKRLQLEKQLAELQKYESSIFPNIVAMNVIEDTGMPDLIRQQNNLPILSTQVQGGRIVELPIETGNGNKKEEENQEVRLEL